MKQNVGVFFGGVSCEHDISIITAVQVMNNLDDNKFNIVPVFIDKENNMKFFNWEYQNPVDILNAQLIPVFLNNGQLYRIGKFFVKKQCKIDKAILCFHGKNGEDGMFSAIMEFNKIPYVNSGILSSAVGMDKVMFKKLMKAYNQPQIKFLEMNEDEFYSNEKNAIEKIKFNLGFPIIIKPSNLGSSIGIEICRNQEDLSNKIKNAFKYDDNVVIEKFIENCKEINIAVFRYKDDLIVSDFERPIKKEEIFSFAEKYINKNRMDNLDAVKEFPAILDNSVKTKILKMVKFIYNKMNLFGVVRFDFIIDNENKVYINEVNTIPGSYAYYLYKEKDISFTRMLDMLLEESVTRQTLKVNKINYFESSVLNMVNLSKK